MNRPGKDPAELGRIFARNGPLDPGLAPPRFVAAARGSRLTLVDGSELLDCASGGVLPLGHNRPEVAETLAMSDHSLPRAGVEFAVRVELMHKLAEVAPGGMNRRVLLCDSGREALARAVGLAAALGPNHGVEFLAARPGAEPKFRAGTGCVVVHPLDTRAGFAARFCRENGCLLVADETGIAPGMTGRVLASELLEERPDVIALGRGLAAGVPFGAAIAGSSELRWKDAGTGGSPAASAVALGYLMRVEGGMLDAVRERSAKLRAALEELVREREGCCVAGAGLVLTLRLGQPRAAAVVALCREAGVLVGQAGDSAVAVRPAATIAEDELDRAVTAVRGALARLD